MSLTDLASTLRHSAAGAAHGPDLSGAAGRAAAGHAVLRGVRGPADRLAGRRSWRASRASRATFVERAVRRGEEGPHLVRRGSGRRGADSCGPSASGWCARCSTWRSSGWSSCARASRACASSASDDAEPLDDGSATWSAALGGALRARAKQQEIARLQQVLALVREPGCQTAALVGYFGETLPARRRAATARVPAKQSVARASRASWWPSGARRRSMPCCRVDAFREVCAAHPAALGEPRQQARFLCGLSSPAQTGARLGRAALFGALADHPFGDVLAWCAAQAAAEGGAPRTS